MLSHITHDFFRNKNSYSIGFVFIMMGLLFGNWATFIPYIKYTYKLDDAQLGIFLLSLPLGALTMNPVAAWSIRTIGMKKTTLFGALFLLFSFSILLSAPNLYFLSFLLFMCGSGIAITNVGMNTCVGALEQTQKVRIMSTCHGMFSLGLMLGSLQASFFRGINANPGIYMASLCILLLLFLIYFKKNIFSIKEEKVSESASNQKFKLPTGNFLLMIIIGLCINITEGSMADWTAVYMRDIVATGPYFVGWGLAGYSALMALGRFLGDKLIPMYGSIKILTYGGILAFTGILISIIFPYTVTAIIGFSLVGAGVSCGAPILYASAARVPNMAAGSGLATMNTFAMGGFLFGPVAIGFISKISSLPMAFALIALLILTWVYFTRKTKLY